MSVVALAATSLSVPVDAVVVPGTNGLIIFETPTDLRTVGEDGVGPVALIGSSGADNDPAFAPNQTFVVFENGGNIFRANPDGSGRTQLTTSGGNSEPQVHPGGTKIVYAKAGAGIFEIPATGGSETQVTGTIAGDNSPDYSPNPTVIFTGTDGIYRTDGNGSRTHVDGTTTGDDNAVVSPNGQWMYLNASGGGIFRVRFPLGGQRTEIPNSAGGFNPMPAPASTHVGWTNGSNIFLARTDGTGGRVELPLSTASSDPHWGSIQQMVIPPDPLPPLEPFIWNVKVPCGSVIEARPLHWSVLDATVSSRDGRDVTLDTFGDLPHIAFEFPPLPKTAREPRGFLFTKPLPSEKGRTYNLGFRATVNSTTADCGYTYRVNPIFDVPILPMS